MKIQKKVYRELMQQLCAGAADREVGGILGGSGGCVTAFFLDGNSLSSHPCCYVPDVEKMNAVIRAWAQRSICFMGMFHTHRDANSLSPQDQSYIQRILEAAAAAQIGAVYFPVIGMEEEKIAVYRGDADSRLILTDALELVEEN